jgi:hypothetical protein
VEKIVQDGKVSPVREKFRLELLEDMGMVARETFKAKYSLIVLKTTARTIIKIGASAGVAAAVEDKYEGLGVLFGFLGQVAATASEQADTRIARYFPGSAWVGGINLEEGMYSVTVNYYGSRGLVYSESQDNVLVQINKLNLTEAVCLK